jgi:hypothetical protein
MFKNNYEMAFSIPFLDSFKKTHIIIQCSRNMYRLIMKILKQITICKHLTFCALMKQSWKQNYWPIHPYINHPEYASIKIHWIQGTMLLYDKLMILHSSEQKTILGVEFITTFNMNTCNPHNHNLWTITFIFDKKNSTHQQLISNSPTLCPTIILGDFNVDALKTQSQSII